MYKRIVLNEPHASMEGLYDADKSYWQIDADFMQLLDDGLRKVIAEFQRLHLPELDPKRFPQHRKKQKYKNINYGYDRKRH